MARKHSKYCDRIICNGKAGFVSQAQVQKYIEQQTKQMAIKQNRNRQVEAKKEIPKQRTLAEIPPKPKGSGILSVS